MDRFDVEAQYKRSLSEVDALVDIEVNSEEDSMRVARLSLLSEASKKIEEALELL